MPKILFIQGSPRKNGNTVAVLEAAAAEATRLGAEVTIMDVASMECVGKGCISCYACQAIPEFECVLDDEVAKNVAKLPEFDRIVLCAPIYFFGLSAQLKIFVDRFFCLMKHQGDTIVSALTGKRIDLIATSGGTEEDSGVRNAIGMVRDMNAFLELPAPEVLYFGSCSPEPAELRSDLKMRTKAAAFARKIIG